MRYKREYWHYSNGNKPFALQLVRECDSTKRPHMHIETVVYDTCSTPVACVEVKSGFSIDGYAFDIWKEVVENGMRIDENEYNRIVDFIIDCITDCRKPRESEISR